DPLIRFTIGLELVKSGIGDIKKSFDIFKEYNSIFVEAARNVGLTTSQIEGMADQAKFANNVIKNGIGKEIESNTYSAKQLSQAISDINSQLGLSVKVSAGTVNEFTAMTNQMGLTADEASNIYRIGLLTGHNLKDTNSLISAGIVAAQKQTGVQINAKQIFQEIGKLNAGITSKFQQNPELIAKAVVQAKALGTSLENIDKIGDSLLNWESSIENELKAELITGKQLNLEKARYAALVGDQITLMKEISNQTGDLTNFQKMNVIAQKSLAEAFGLSREELADMLKKQDVFNKLGDVSGKSAQEQLDIARQRGLSENDSLMVNLKQQAAAEKLSATWDSIKMSIAELLGGPFKGLVDVMSSLSHHAWLVYGAVGLLAGISFAKMIGGLTLMVVELAAAAGEAITLQGILTAGLALIALPAILGAAYGAISSIKSASEKSVPQLAEGGIVPATPGGTTVTVAEGGKNEAIIPLNSPQANKMLGTSSIDLTPMVAAINEVRNAVKELANRPSIAYIKGEDAFAKNLGAVNALGSSQVQNTYKLA
ncbi:MAG: hypothetical protein JSS98_19135, partial [Bacteroidetes bacterium]|nr:hypothetical protein [Bacteroidota bacterium]